MNLKKLLFGTFLIVSLSITHSTLHAQEMAAAVSKDFTQVAKQAIPAVVAIKVKTVNKQSEMQDLFNEDLFQFFFGVPGKELGKEHRSLQRQPEPVLGQASGFVVSKDGYVMTNSHVVKDATEIVVTLNDGRDFPAKVVGQDPSTDVALLKIEATDLPYLELGDSEALEIGQWVVAIGNPLGLKASLTVGVVSAKGRNNLDLATIEDFIQTDASINKGNSGGPLLDLRSRVVGINTAIVSNMGSGGYMGIGFAIPSNIAKHVMDQLLKTGSISRGFMGVSLQAIDKDLAQAFGLKNTNGALIADVSKGSPAEKAGIQQGDVILAINKQAVTNIGALRNTISLMSPGTKVMLTLLRNGKSIELPFEIGSYPKTEEVSIEAKGNSLGFEAQNLTPELAKSLGLHGEEGVVITKVETNSPASWAGLKKGAIILAVNQQKIHSVEQLNEVMKSNSTDKPLLLLVKQGEVIRFISLK